MNWNCLTVTALLPAAAGVAAATVPELLAVEEVDVEDVDDDDDDGSELAHPASSAPANTPAARIGGVVMPGIRNGDQRRMKKIRNGGYSVPVFADA